MSLEQSIDRLNGSVEALTAALRTAKGLDAGPAQVQELQEATQPELLDPPKKRGRPPKAVIPAAPEALAAVPATLLTPATKTPLTQMQTTELIDAFTALGKSAGGQGREIIASLLKEFGVDTVIGITGEQCAAAVARAKELTA